MNKVQEKQLKIRKMKAEKAKQQDNNESTVEKCQIGKPIQIENIKPIESIIEEEFKVAIEGVIFDINLKELKSGRHIVELKVTDYTDSLVLKMFTRKIKMTWTTLRHLVLVNGLELKVVLKKILLLGILS